MDVMLAMRDARNQDSRCKRIAGHLCIFLPYILCTVVGVLFVTGLLAGQKLFYAITAVLVFCFVVVAISWIRWRKRNLLQPSHADLETDINPGYTLTPSRRRLSDISHQMMSLETAFKGLQPRLVGNDATLRQVQTLVVEISECQRTVKEWLLNRLPYTDEDIERTASSVTRWTSQYESISLGDSQLPPLEPNQVTENEGAQSVFVLKPPAYEESDKYGPPKYAELESSTQKTPASEPDTGQGVNPSDLPPPYQSNN